MELVRDIEELAEGDLLDHADEVARMQRQCEVQVVRIAVQHAIIHNPDRLDPELTRLPGRERARRCGGVGTQQVAEFGCATLGARLGVTSYAAWSLMADGLDLVIRLPRLWQRVEAFEVKVSYARYVARRTRDLTLEQAAYVDERVAESADGRVPWSRFEELVAGLVAAADPEGAAEAERRAAEQQVARPTRSTEHGMRGFFIRGPFSVIARLDATVTYFADMLAAMGDTDPVDVRRVKAVALLAMPHRALEVMAAFQEWEQRPADPEDLSDSPEEAPTRAEPARTGDRPAIDWDKVLPSVTLIVHTYRACGGQEAGDDVLRTEGHGPVTKHWLRAWLGDARITVRPVLDIEGLAPVDAYEIPDQHRRAVQLMNPADTFPWGTATTRTHQVDHTIPHGKDGPSRIGNYGSMSTFHHRLKTHGGWQVSQPFPGIYVWRDPHGETYLVDNTGTRRISDAA